LQIEWAVADGVGVFLKVREELVEVAFAVLQLETRSVEGVAGPVERRGRTEQGSCAPVEHAANDTMLLVVVRCGCVAAVVKPR
jgi:hypothetical protein